MSSCSESSQAMRHRGTTLPQKPRSLSDMESSHFTSEEKKSVSLSTGINNHFIPPVQRQSNLCPSFENPSRSNVLTASNAANTSNLDANSPHEGFPFSNRGQSDTFQERSSHTLIEYDYLLSSVKYEL
ncbi:hypothetical protein TNCV_4058991 [Trichonephila clavipes]|nr:hypothetical protein TNCV_4058991 [Trichonephila clavipes]